MGLAFELGLAHPESLIEDRPTAFGAYVPVNFDGFNRGTVTIRQALMQSLNIPAVVVLDAVGTPRLMQRLKRANANPLLPDDTAPGLAVGLGGVGVTLRDLVSLYAAIARGGSPVRLQDGVSVVRARTRRCRSGARSGLGLVCGRYPRATCRRRSTARPGASPTRPAPPMAIATPGRSALTARPSSASGSGRPDGAPVPGISGMLGSRTDPVREL